MRKYFHMIRMTVQIFTRNSVWIVLLALSTLVTIGSFYYVYDKEPFIAVQMTAYGHVVLTLLFMVFGIEIRKEQRLVNFDDLVIAYSQNPTFILRCHIIALGILDLLVTAIITLACGVYLYFAGASILWINQTILYILLLYFLPCLILGVWGLLNSQVNSGKSVYLFAMAGWLITSNLSTYFRYYTEPMGLGNGGFIYNLLHMGINNFQSIGNVSTGTPIESPRWIVRIGILLILYVCYLLSGTRKSYYSVNGSYKFRFKLIVASLSCLAIIIVFSLSYFVFFTRFADPDDSDNYVMNKSSNYVAGQPNSLQNYPTEKNISLSKSNIDISCSAQGLQAEVLIEAVANNEIDSQSFTLYSDLIVDSVFVDNEQVQFDRSLDGILVHFTEIKKPGDKIALRFRYHGYSLPYFPANETTVQLDRAFPWIPWPGIKTATIYGNYFNYDDSESFFIEDWQREDNIEFTLLYHGPGNIYTNLEKCGDNIYTGYSKNGVTIYSGVIHNKYRGIDLYLPANMYQYSTKFIDSLLSSYPAISDLCEKMGSPIIPEIPQTVLVLQMKMPIINDLVYPQELYSWGTDWEIRLRSDTSPLLFEFHDIGDTNDLSEILNDFHAKIAVPFLLNPCSGYPINISHTSTTYFTAWLSLYLSAPGMDEGDIKFYIEKFKSEYSGTGVEYINECLVLETPLSDSELLQIEKIIKGMQHNQNFDVAFRTLYHRLLNGENITASDIVSELNADLEVNR